MKEGIIVIIAIAADFNALLLKTAIVKHLEAQGHAVTDFSGDGENRRLYLDVAPDAIQMLQTGQCERGILLCGTGMGMAILANKHKGVYAACCESVYAAKKCRVINNANVLTMGAWIIGERMACEMVDAFLTTELGEGLEDWRKKNVTGFFEKTQRLEDELFRSAKEGMEA